MKFKLKSSYQPTGDQPEAIRKLTESIKAGNPHQTLMGVTGSGKTFTMANVIQNLQRPTLVISHNKTLAGQLYQELRDYFPDNAVSYFVSYYDYYQPEAYLPSTDTYIEKETNINSEIDKLRLSATANLLSRPDVIVVASVSCIYNLGSPVEFMRNFIELVDGELISKETLSARLSDIQYLRSDFELKRGTFRVQGDSLSVWPADNDTALKISFLGQVIENIIPINPLTGEKIKLAPSNTYQSSQKFVIYPAKHYQAKTADQNKILKEIKRDLTYRLNELKQKGRLLEAYRLNQRVQHDLEMIIELGYVNGIENYSRYFDGRKSGDPPFSLLDYFSYNHQLFNSEAHPKTSFLTIIDESHITVPQLRGMYRGDQARKQVLIDYGFRLPSALDNRPLTFDECLLRLPQILYASATPEVWELNQSGKHVAEQLIRPTGLIDPTVEIKPVEGQVQDLVKQIIYCKAKNQRVLVTTLTKRTAEALTDYLNNPKKIADVYGKSSISPKMQPKVQYLHADVLTLDRQDILDSLRRGDFDVVVGINLLREGLDLPEVALVAILEADKEGFLRSKNSLIQTMGRAARHDRGHVILYADNLTSSMKAAIDEVERRRQTQLQYNIIHQITPQSIDKPIRSKMLIRSPKQYNLQLSPELHQSQPNKIEAIDLSALTPKDIQVQTKKYRNLMNQASKEWNFELAAKYRDIIKILEKGKVSL